MSIDSMAKGERDDEWHFTLLLARAHELHSFILVSRDRISSAVQAQTVGPLVQAPLEIPLELATADNVPRKQTVFGSTGVSEHRHRAMGQR